jgi:hypothetical protein
LTKKIEQEFVDKIRRSFINRNISPCLSENVKPSPNEKLQEPQSTPDPSLANTTNFKPINDFFRKASTAAAEGKGPRKASLGAQTGAEGLLNELDSRDKHSESGQKTPGPSDPALEKPSNEGE